MRRVALLAYYFPPLGGAGVQRAAKLAEHLPSLGWEPVVVTGPATGGSRWSPRDETLANGLEDVTVVRVDGPEPPAGDSRAQRWAGLPSPWSRWWVEGASAALAGLRDIDLVLATLSPFEGAAAAASGAEALGVPWVADLRDPWALDEMFAYPTRLHRLAARRAMRASLAGAAAIVMNTDEAATALVEAFPELRSKTAAAVPNGYDALDFAVEAAPRTDSAFRIVHTGYLHTDLGGGAARAAVRAALGGAVGGVDIGARSHVHLVAAIDELRRREPVLGATIELHLAGVLSEEDVAASDRPYIVRHGYLPHRESIALTKSADALFLPMHDLPPGKRARIVPGKTYEYLAAARPILATVPDGDARDLLERAGNAAVCRPRDVAGIADALQAMATRHGPVAAPRDEVVARFERRRLAAELAAVLDRAAGGQSAAAAA